MSRPNLATPEEQSSSSFDFRAFYHTLSEKAWVLVTCIVVAAFCTVGYLQRAPVLYSSTATLQVEQDEEKVVNIQAIRQEDLRGQEVLRTIEQTLQSRTILERVVDTNNLAHDPGFVAAGTPTPSKERLIAKLTQLVNVRLRRGTRLIDITVAHTSPQLTARIANSIVQEFLSINYEQYTNQSRLANQFLEDEKERLKKKLHESEVALQQYKETTGSISLNEKQDIVGPKLKELSQRLTEATNSIMRLETEGAQMRRLGTNDLHALLVLSIVANDRDVVEAQTSLNKAENDFVALRQRYKEKHPKFLQAVSQLDEYRKAFTNAVAKVPQTVEASLESARVAAAALDNALKNQVEASMQLNKQAIQYNVLLREVETDQKQYDAILNRLKETGITRQLYSNKVRIIQPAYVPERSFSPNRQKVIIQGLAAGIVGGILLILLINSLDTSLKTVDQAEQYLHLPVLTAVPQLKEMKDAKRRLIVSEDAKSLGAEAFRSLRTSLTMLGREEERKVFLFTSAVPEEGKTFCSVNYAASLAQRGLRTLVIDCDLRRPAVEVALHGRKSHDPGVTDFLTGQKKLGDIVHRTELENFSYIPAGTTAPNPAELLAQGGLNNLLEEVGLHFDRVVIDSAPIHAVSDTLLILDRVQTVCVVVRATKTARKAVSRAIKLLQNAGAPLGGIILNRLPRRRGRGYYYDPYYDYSYHSTYGEKGVYGG